MVPDAMPFTITLDFLLVLLVKVHSLSLQELRFILQCQSMKYAEELSLYCTHSNISQSILQQWNHVCFSSEIWLHATTKPTTWNINMYVHRTHRTSTTRYTHLFAFVYTYKTWILCCPLYLRSYIFFSCCCCCCTRIESDFSPMQMEMHTS